MDKIKELKIIGFLLVLHLIINLFFINHLRFNVIYQSIISIFIIITIITLSFLNNIIHALSVKNEKRLSNEDRKVSKRNN